MPPCHVAALRQAWKASAVRVSLLSRAPSAVAQLPEGGVSRWGRVWWRLRQQASLGFRHTPCGAARGAPGLMAANPGARAIGFRARTVDVNVRLGLLRSADELSEEAAVSRVAAHSHVALDRENEEVRISPPTAVPGPAGGPAGAGVPKRREPCTANRPFKGVKRHTLTPAPCCAPGVDRQGT